MEFRPDVNCMHRPNVILPGGQDKDGHPIIIITIPPESPQLDVAPSLSYILSIFSNETKRKGLTVIIDAQKGPWRVAKSCIRQVTTTMAQPELAKLLILRPDAFWDKQRVENCTNIQTDGEVTFIPRSRLGKFVDQSQLPLQLGGCFIYNHEQWIENRLKLEEYYKDVAAILQEVENLQERLATNRKLRTNEIEDVFNSSLDMTESIKNLIKNAIDDGCNLGQNIEANNRTRKYASESEAMLTPQDTLDTLKKLEKITENLRLKEQQIEQAWKDTEKSCLDSKDLNNLEEGVAKVTNWILGPAEKLLNFKQKVGYDVASAEQLRREHDEIELNCWETYGTYAELVHKIEQFSTSDDLSESLKNLIFQKDFMDFVCRSFASRLERRRNTLITSLRFFRLVSEYFDKTGEVFDSLVMGNKIGDFATAERKLRELQDNQATLDAVERELVKEGEKLSDMLSMPVKDALGREIPVDYIEDIVNVRDILDATTARRNIFSDSVELQKLTLEQVTHIYEYEKDAEQAVKWLNELFQVMLKDHGHVGCSVYEIQSQKDEHQTFQETAKGTYSYGCQVLNASLALRESCKLPTDEHNQLLQRLNESWHQLLSVSQEQMTRLRVSAVFHRSVEEQCNQLRDLREAVATIALMDVTKRKAKIKCYFAAREKLLVEVGRMVRLGKLLRSRLREPLFFEDEGDCQWRPNRPEFSISVGMSQPTTSDDTSKEFTDEQYEAAFKNAIAVEGITEKLAEVTSLAEELDQALRSAQQDSTASSSVTIPILVTPSISGNALKSGDALSTSTEGSPNLKRPEELKSDEEFQTASDCTLQHSRSSSYNTASECEHRYSPWWEFDKNKVNEKLAKEKLVLAVGLPELPPVADVVTSSPEVPPGKIVREVTETTHLKVQHSYNLGVSSFVLTSETVKEKDSRADTTREEVVRVREEQVTGSSAFKETGEDELVKRMKEVGGSLDEDAWRNYQFVTKQAIRGFL